jgi:RNA polymerase sigma factor (sigma-70 family)
MFAMARVADHGRAENANGRRVATRRRPEHQRVAGLHPATTVATMQPTTRTLVHDARRDPRQGFAALHERAARQLFAWAALHVAPPLRARLPLEDFVQEVWARAFAAFRGYDAAKGSFRGWLLGIAYNVLREQLRGLQRRRPAALVPLGSDDTGEVPRDPATSIVSRAARGERIASMLAAVDALADDERRLVAWRGLEGLPYDEIGRRLGLSAIAVESRWRRLAARLHDVLPADDD